MLSLKFEIGTTAPAAAAVGRQAINGVLAQCDSHWKMEIPNKLTPIFDIRIPKKQSARKTGKQEKRKKGKRENSEYSETTLSLSTRTGKWKYQTN